MAQELQYTSVAEGLKLGTRGFCAVVMTRGMSPQVAGRLESLSGYDMFYKVGSPHIDNNPRHYAHWIVMLDGRPAHVLSFVTFSGMDFEGRANKFAHHIYLDESDLSAGGPGWMIMQQSVMERWYMPPPRWTEPRSMPKGDTVVCRPDAWIKFSGDAGWAGALAQHLLDTPNKPAYIIYPITIDPLPLIAEAQAFLPKASRWDATFSTYFSRLPADMSCVWRCCLEGTESAREAREAAERTLVIDLTAPRKLAPNGRLAVAARLAPPRFNPASLRKGSAQGAEPETSVPLPAESTTVTHAAPASPAKTLPPIEEPLELPPSTPIPAEAPASAAPPAGQHAPLPKTAASVQQETHVPQPPAAGVKAPQRPRHVEPTSMMDLGNEENDAAELEAAVERQIRAKQVKTRAVVERPAPEKQVEESREPLLSDEDTASAQEPAQETPDSAFDSSMTRVAEPDGATEAPPDGTDDEGRSARVATWLVVLAIILVTASLVAALLPYFKTLTAPQGNAPTGKGVTSTRPALPVDPRLPRIELTPNPIPAKRELSAVALNFTSPSSAAPVPAVTRISKLAHASGNEPFTACKIVWLADFGQEPPAAGTDQPPIDLIRKNNRIDVLVPCEAAQSKTGKLAVGALMIEKDELIWRWVYTGAWSEKMQQAWALIMPTLSQSVVEVDEPSGTPIAKIQLVVPIERVLQSDTGAAVFSDLRPASTPALTVGELPPGWRTPDEAQAGKPLELTHISGAKVTFNAVANKAIWTVVTEWPSDSRADRLASTIAQQEQEINQLLVLKTSPDAIAETEGDANRLKDELERMTSQIEQAKSRKPVDAAAVATLETRRGELAVSFKQMREKLEKMKTAPAAIEALRAQRKAASERLDAVRQVIHNPVFVTASRTGAVLAVVNLVNSAPRPDNASAPVP